MDKLKSVIAEEKRRDPKGYQAAEEKGELLQFLDPALKKANVNPVLLKRLEEENVSFSIESYVDLASETLDDIFYEPFYHHQLPSNHMGLAEVLSNLRSSSQILIPLKRIKVLCAISALFCFGLSIRYAIGKYIPHSLVLLLFAGDLFRVSYNCYDKKYCSLYLHMIGGNPIRAADTIFKFVSSMVGISEPSVDPFVGLRKEIVWKNLVQDTMLRTLYYKVSTIKLIFCCT